MTYILLYILFTIWFANFASAYKLADKETMTKQLMSVCNNKYLIDKYIPLLLKHAGYDKTPMGIAMMFSTTNYDFYESTLKYLSFDIRVAIQLNINLVIPKFIIAILHDNLTEAEEAINIWNNRKYLGFDYSHQ